MSEPFFIICDGQPVAGTGTPVTVYGLFEGTPDLPELIVYGRSARQPTGPLLSTRRGEAYPLEFHSESPGWGWRLGRLLGLNQLAARPSPKTLAERIRRLGVRKALVFGPGSDLLFYAARLLRRLPDVETALYLLDDQRIPLRGSRNPVYRCLASRTFEELVGRCSRRFAITPEMAERYRRAFGTAFEVMPIPVRDDCFHSFGGGDPPANAPGPPAFPVFLCGSLGPDLAGSLRCLAQAFARLAEHGGIEPKLVVSGRTPVTDLHRLGFAPHQVESLGWLPSREAVLRRAAEAACTFVPYLFDARRSDFYETSFPGKIADYWVAGAPVLLHAPASSAVARHFRRHGLDFLCYRMEPPALAEALAQIAALTPARRQEVRRSYLALVERDHLASEARARLLGANRRSH